MLNNSGELRGSIEIAVFLKQGLLRFADTREAAIASLRVPLFLIPFAAAFNLASPQGDEHGYMWCLAYVLISWITTTGLFLTFIWLIMSVIKGQEEAKKLPYLRFIAIYNWLNLPGFMLQIPFLLFATLGLASWDGITPFLVTGVLYGYAYQAHAIARNFSLHIALGAAISIGDILCGSLGESIASGLLAP